MRKKDYHECLKFCFRNKVMFVKVTINWITNKLLPNFNFFLQIYKHAYKIHAIGLYALTSFFFVIYKVFCFSHFKNVKPFNFHHWHMIMNFFPRMNFKISNLLFWYKLNPNLLKNSKERLFLLQMEIMKAYKSLQIILTQNCFRLE